MIRTVLALLLLGLCALACDDGDRPQRTALRPEPVASTATLPRAVVGVAASAETLEVRPPLADAYDLGRRLGGIDLAPVSLTEPPITRPGESRRFFVLDLDANRPQEVTAELRVQTAHADLWVQAGQRASREELERAGEQFETAVYPRVTETFGLPAPAADGSPGRIAILHTNLRGASGYFSGTDQLPRRLVPYSNEQQIVYLDLSAARPGDAAYAGLLAHEFQHLVHQQRNPSAETWINEGLSEVANELLGGNNAFLRRFEVAPDTQLNAWPPDGNTAAHYGAAHSFLRYLLHHHGGVVGAKELAAGGDTGVNSVERYLRRGGFDTGFLDVFADWTVANLLDEPGERRFSQPGIEHRTRAVERLPNTGSRENTVHQFGTRYLQVEPGGRDLALRFDGSESVARVSALPVSGRGLWWSNRADAINSTLTRELDLSAVERATLRFKLWFSIERDYDYAYATVSRDGGRNWQVLSGRHTTDRDPLRVAYGPGYSGRSGGETPVWVDEEIDLSPYAGERILLRFEYVTDEATADEGLALDDISVPEIGFADDAEREGGWQASGFLRVAETLPQRFIVQIVEEGERGRVEIRRIDLDARNDVTITVSRGVRKATLVISGATFGSIEPARFALEAGR